jgi:hypothetical protein
MNNLSKAAKQPYPDFPSHLPRVMKTPKTALRLAHAMSVRNITKSAISRNLRF